MARRPAAGPRRLIIIEVRLLLIVADDRMTYQDFFHPASFASLVQPGP